MNNRSTKKYISITLVFILTFIFSAIVRAQNIDIGTIVDNIGRSADGILTLINTLSVVAGLSFAVASAFKFKHHKDSPTQVTVGQPIALLFLGALMIWMPYIIDSVGYTITGANTQAELESLEGNRGAGRGFRGKLLKRAP